jgi:hypothetical protein
MAEASVVQRALAECWAGEVSGVAYYEALGERFPEHRHEADVLALVEKTTRELIEAVARNYEVSIDHDAAERVGVEVAQLGSDWREVLEKALAFTPDTLRMYESLADCASRERIRMLPLVPLTRHHRYERHPSTRGP